MSTSCFVLFLICFCFIPDRFIDFFISFSIDYGVLELINTSTVLSIHRLRLHLITYLKLGIHIDTTYDTPMAAVVSIVLGRGLSPYPRHVMPRRALVTAHVSIRMETPPALRRESHWHGTTWRLSLMFLIR
ncbi:hypothetical protein F4777DRAFT_565245 [Nemania sp. FL0916]|nr:hypothetical protein F4777DRAFT_565245 [Nemania sp. FL0916]